MGNVRGNKYSNSKWDSTRIAAIVILVAIFVLSYCLIHFGLVQDEDNKSTSYFARAKVVSMIIDNTQSDETTEGLLRGSQEVIIEITSGQFKGKQYQTSNYLSMLFNINCKEGTRVIVRLDPRSEDDGYSAFIYSYDRTFILLGLFLVFALSLIIIGRGKGTMSLLSLIFILISAILVTILIVFYTTVFTFVLIDGINRKTISAALGTLSGVVIASVFAAIAGALSHISGFQTNEAEELLLIGTDHGMKLKGLFTVGILIASLGAVMDVAMSIASAIHELHEVNDKMTAMELFHSGMNIGRDAMGTMANTLILAFAGSSFTLLLLIYYYNISFTQLMNTDMVAREVIQGLSGSIGIVLTVPIVAILSARIETLK